MTAKTDLYCTVEEALEDVRKGIPIIMADHAEREDEGDLVIAAEKATVENLAFIALNARGIMCLPCDGHILDRLDIPMMVQRNTDRRQTPFTVSIDAAEGITTGVPASDRLKTIRVLLDPDSRPSDLVRPGHLFPLRPHPLGLRGRQGHTEGSIELMRLSGLKPVAVISEIMNADGTMARGQSLLDFAKKWKLKILTIPDMIAHIESAASKANLTAVILSAGGVREELVSLTGTNCSALIPVNGKPAIYWNMSYLIGLGVRQFVIVARPEMEALRNYVQSMFGSLADVRFVDGNPSGGPGDSLLAGLKLCETAAALVVLGDTVFQFNAAEEKRLSKPDDFVLTSEVEDHWRWCMASIGPEAVVREWKDKRADTEKGDKALVGVYKFSDARLMLETLERIAAANKSHGRRTEISEGLAAYGKHKPIHALPLAQWLDLGNADNLIGSRKKSIAVRAYNSFSFDDLLGTITKKSEDAKLVDELAYYRKLPAAAAVLFPRVLSHKRTGALQEMTLEYYGYPNLGELLCYGAPNPAMWSRIVKKLSKILELWSKTETGPGKKAHAEAMYVEKTEREYGRLAALKEFKELTAAGTLVLDGRELKNFTSIWPMIRTYAEKSLLKYRSSMIHGDCCLANILYDGKSDNFRFVDPRGSFGAKGITGDIRYDVAKLYHSFDGGYEYLINDMFTLEKRKDGYSVRLINGKAKETPLALFEKEFFKRFDRRQILTIEGMIYVGMCARHYDSPKRQVAMYLTGVRLLNDSLGL